MINSQCEGATGLSPSGRAVSCPVKIEEPLIALVDDNDAQIEATTAEGVDFVHVSEYLWKAAWSFSETGEPAAEHWVARQAIKILQRKARQVATGIRRRATRFAYSQPSAPEPRMHTLPHRQSALPRLRHQRSPAAGRSPPVSSRERASGWSKTGWT
jgi:hypothetical protein